MEEGQAHGLSHKPFDLQFVRHTKMSLDKDGTNIVRVIN